MLADWSDVGLGRGWEEGRGEGGVHLLVLWQWGMSAQPLQSQHVPPCWLVRNLGTQRYVNVSDIRDDLFFRVIPDAHLGEDWGWRFGLAPAGRGRSENTAPG